MTRPNRLHIFGKGALALLTLNIGYWVVTGGLASIRRADGGLFTPSSLVGREFEVDVRRPNNIVASTERDVLVNSCTYVIVYQASCGPSGASTRRLIATAEDGAELPPGWSIAILMLDSLPDTESLLGHASQWDVWMIRGGFKAASASGLAATPMHLIVHQSGRILQAGIGADLWIPSAYQPDCTIRAESRRAGFTPVPGNS